MTLTEMQWNKEVGKGIPALGMAQEQKPLSGAPQAASLPLMGDH
jgi:hypothetical protein